MKNMSRSRWLAALAGVGLGLAAAVSVAQTAWDYLPTLDVVNRKLELTPEQQTRLRPIFDARLAELHQARVSLDNAKSKAEKSQILQTAKQKGTAFNSSVEAVLTPSQKPKWRELRTATREKLKQAYEDKKDKE